MAHPDASATQRLYLEDPRRKTALAQISGHASGGFLLDRTIYHAPRRDYHHAQPDDRGHVLAEGHKLKLDKVFRDSRDRIVHRTSGPLPSTGEKAQLHLDWPRREKQARAHTALHLLVAAAVEARADFLDAPHVVGARRTRSVGAVTSPLLVTGGGEARLHLQLRDPPKQAVPKILQRAQQMIDQRLDVTTQWAPRDDCHHLVTHHPVPLDDIAPDEPTLRLTRIGEASTLPCDAPLVTNTREIGTLEQGLLQVRKDGSVRLGARVVA